MNTQARALKKGNIASDGLTIAYFILVHRLPNQFKRLFKAIYHPDNCYLIHIDKKVNAETYDEISSFLKDFPNTYILESTSVLWGGYSMVEAELQGINHLLKINDKWDYFINLSGQDYPLKSQRIVKEFLAKHLGNNYIKIADQIAIRPETLNRIENYFVETDSNVSTDLTKRDYLTDTAPYIGGQWMILTRACCEFLCNSIETKRFENYYKNTLIADESFFQTVLMNSSFKGKYMDDDKRAIIWIADGGIKLRPKTFTKEDIVFLEESGCLFARKFDDNVDSDIINKLATHFNTPLVETILQLSLPMVNTYSKLTSTN